MERKEQLTLGKLINKLKPLIGNTKSDGEEATIEFDFGSAIPTGLSSYRGYYDQLGINYSFNGYGNMIGYKKNDSSTFEPRPYTVSEFVKILEEAIGKVYTGWKGGDFMMNQNTPLWVSNDGDADDTVVIDVLDKGYKIIIETQYKSW